MKKIVILGSGAGGTMCAAKLRRKLGRNWKMQKVLVSLDLHLPGLTLK